MTYQRNDTPEPLAQGSTMDSRLTHIIVAEGGYWGKGSTLVQAKANYKAAAGRKATAKAIIYAVTPEAHINDHGYIAMPRALYVEPQILQG